jgi:BMFP domain-containing protein YqiC
MTQTNNPILDQIARMMTDAAGAAQGLRREIEGMVKAQGERIVADMNLVRREEHDAVKEMAAKAREENEQLAERVRRLEEMLSQRGGGP